MNKGTALEKELELELIVERLEQAREMIGIVYDEVFDNEIGLYVYYRRFGAILDYAASVIDVQLEEIRRIMECK